MKASSHDCSHSNKGSHDHESLPHSQHKKREQTSSSLRSVDRRAQKQEQKRHEQLSAKWDQAKKEVRQEDHDVLKEKIVLQQELIRKQDEAAEYKRQQELQQQQQKKEEDRQKRLAKEKELQQICRQSLEEDKKAQREEKRARVRARKDDPTSPRTPSKSSPTKQMSPTTPPTPGSRRSNPFRMSLPTMTATPDIMDSSDDEDKPKPMEIPKDVPWHEQQLYKLYGKGADYFLHPKMENKAQVKKVNPKLRRQGGRAGADVLWQTLRHDSQMRLKQEDAHIPIDLKLPMMNRLLDNSRVQKIRKMRHKTDLMYRASISNQDRNEVLTFNNPLPEFHERTESIDQYLPSWIDDQSESSYPDYLRWIMRKNPGQATIREGEEEEEGGDTERTADGQGQADRVKSMDDDLIYILSQRQPRQPKQKYIFLSEKDTTVKGEFSEKYKDEREYKDLPRPYKGEMPKSYSAMGGSISRMDADKPDPTLRYSAPLPSRQNLLNNYTSGWQPLTMHSLVEYKKQLGTIGEGEYQLGRAKLWSQIPVV